MFVLAFLLSLAVVGTGKASPALTFGCDPDVTIGLAISDTFDVYLTAFDVTDLFLVDYFLSFDPAILSTSPADIDYGVNPGVDALDSIMIETVVGGVIHIVAGRPIGVKVGLSGDITTVKITFTVVADGNCGLYFYDNPDTTEVEPRLKDSGGVDMTIDRIIDGFYGGDEKGKGHYIYACNSTEGLQNIFAEGESVWVVGGGFAAVKMDVHVYVVPNTAWVDQQAIGAPVIPMVIIQTYRNPPAPHVNFALPHTNLGVIPPGSYDIVADYDQDGLYDAATDGLDDVFHWPGFTVLGVVPEFPFGISVIMLLAPIIPLAYLWRLRRKVTKQ